MLSLFFLCLINVALVNTKSYERFSHVEEVSIEKFNEHSSETKVNWQDLNLSLNKLCFPLYNTERNGTRRLTQTVFAFNFETNLKFETHNGYNSWEISIYDNDIPATGEVLDNVHLVEVCQTSSTRNYRHINVTQKISCRTREFKKEYIVALCQMPQYTRVLPFTTFLRATGYVYK